MKSTFELTVTLRRIKFTQSMRQTLQLKFNHSKDVPVPLTEG
jgi:hypothetical protein